ncbi:DnaK family protein [Synechococcus sp. PCC 7335]|uniref:Hsp70 family protein n=1 Tax=Synechococcus sp. (strain ATCC 29403 / PCC 7335) TaxID=91464 RepID=UPI00017EDD76|nr:Hsp70 family protein [Synechococcus sp. PCC 7335]EDX83139.1 DnaK family protein [Synechococcus sp. PCC 7335]
MHLGIDFGTCYSSAALMLDGTFQAVKEPLKHGYSFPSSAFLTKQGNIVVGQAAENQYKLAPNRYCREFKRDFGCTVPYTLGGRGFLPEQLILELLCTIKAEAEQMVNAPLSTAVITVPATYQSYKRELMEQVATQAGFKSVALLEEPVAAATYYARKQGGNQRLTKGNILLIYDLGGGTFDASLIQKNSKGYDLLAQPVGDEQLGGVDFDRQIYQDLKANCSKTLQALLNPRCSDTEALRAQLIVGDWCRNFKHQLSVVSEYEDLLPIGMSETYQLSQNDFSEMIAPFLQRTCQLSSQLVKNAGLDWDKVDQILMVGGSCRIPAVKKVLEESFERPLVLVDDPELAVAYGSAIYEISRPTRKPERTLENNEVITIQPADIQLSNEPNQKNVIDGAKKQQMSKTSEDTLAGLVVVIIVVGICVFVFQWPIWLAIIFVVVRLLYASNK